ncbi:heavy metal-associated isoprenylated plant protein 41-like [Humulus lupulus]|uniref:heavy metal-associated isoprenylated plant protein 41-like n=1 Tax=Humulus lupulus TaxID=3486 RepID=UPI002B40FA45|nr:heavy metal-associated isoprenylated plant protein 41-like [Humulus lupulus]
MGFEEEEEEEEKWIQYYSSNHQILIVGDGDFSFSSSLATSFSSAFNIVATSLDSYDVVVKKYKKARSHLEHLTNLGASCLHGVNATMMKIYSELRMRKFDRIIFNFPHAGFGAREDDTRLIHKHRCLVHGFFFNARSMLRPNGEIHVNHKTTPPFSWWNLEELAAYNSLSLMECVEFNIKDYPGYNNKRGDGSKCDKTFRLGKCSTFKFGLSNSSHPRATTSSFEKFHRRFEKFQVQNPSIDFDRSQMDSVRLTSPLPGFVGEKNLNFDRVRLPLEASFRNREDHQGMVSPVNELRHERTTHHGIEMLLESNRRTCYDMSPSVNEARRSTFNSETTTMIPRRIWNPANMHNIKYQESDQRTCYPAVDELNRANRNSTRMRPGRTLNQGIHMWP